MSSYKWLVPYAFRAALVVFLLFISAICGVAAAVISNGICVLFALTAGMSCIIAIGISCFLVADFYDAVNHWSRR